MAYEVYPLQLSSKLIAYFPPPPLPPLFNVVAQLCAIGRRKKKLDATRSSVPSPNIVCWGEGGGGAWAIRFDEGGRVLCCPLRRRTYSYMAAPTGICRRGWVAEKSVRIGLEDGKATGR